jgi:hypothetical protein
MVDCNFAKQFSTSMACESKRKLFCNDEILDIQESIQSAAH